MHFISNRGRLVAQLWDGRTLCARVAPRRGRLVAVMAPNSGSLSAEPPIAVPGACERNRGCLAESS